MIQGHQQAATTDESELKGAEVDAPVGEGAAISAAEASPKLSVPLNDGSIDGADPKLDSDSAAMSATTMSVAGASPEQKPQAKEGSQANPDLNDFYDNALNPNRKVFANRSGGTAITNAIARGTGKLGATTIAGAGLASAALGGTTIAAAAGDSKASELVGSAFGAGIEGVSSANKALKVDTWGDFSSSTGHDYNTAASQLGTGAAVGGGLTGAMGAVSIGTGIMDISDGFKRSKAASKKVVNPDGTVTAKDAAGVTLGNETAESGINSVRSGIYQTISGGTKIAAATVSNDALSAGLLATSNIYGGLIGGLTAAQALKFGLTDATNWIKGWGFKPLTDKGRSWHKFAKNKKIQRGLFSALKFTGGALGVAAAVVGTVAGAGIPLLIAGGIIGGGMAASKIYRSWSDNKKTSDAKAQMRKDNWYEDLSGEYKAIDEANKPDESGWFGSKWWNRRKSRKKAEKEKKALRDKKRAQNANIKKSQSELEKIKQTRLEQKREKAGDPKAESKFSVARGIKDALKSVGGILGITAAVRKVKQMLDAKAADDKAAADAKASQKKAAAAAKPKFWSNWGRKKPLTAIPAAADIPAVESATEATINPLISAQSSAAPAAPSDSTPAAPAAPAAEPSSESEKPSDIEKEAFDAFNISQKIGVSAEEAISGSGEELIEKRLSVTNSL
ncbi:MAG: hypothetical protein NBV77_01985 [Bacteroidia bacterium]|nr:hypothetical protein [Bacteroidia bacterium]